MGQAEQGMPMTAWDIMVTLEVAVEEGGLVGATEEEAEVEVVVVEMAVVDKGICHTGYWYKKHRSSALLYLYNHHLHDISHDFKLHIIYRRSIKYPALQRNAFRHIQIYHATRPLPRGFSQQAITMGSSGSKQKSHIAQRPSLGPGGGTRARSKGKDYDSKKSFAGISPGTVGATAKEKAVWEAQTKNGRSHGWERRVGG
ncbi:hypothetical protein CC80DRAFT_544252 [Byssothecium circinans]|uniref:Uncharacterized protein n=1 Tax=Byssothecium circinans TaxID=147558 RepID=A0A6A5UIG4_9PLEO|nr:hypothetical protein CC80DRAFT_544252 [Byssothecium circinans]